jgi:hypothetical protein
MSEVPKDQPTADNRAMNEVPNSAPHSEPKNAKRVAPNRQSRRQRVRLPAPHSEPKYEPTDAERAALNRLVQRQKERLSAPCFNEAGPGDADRAVAKVPNSQPKYEPTDAERVALNRQARRPRLDGATAKVPNSEPKYETTDAERAAPHRQAQPQKEQPPAPRFNEAGPEDADRAMTEVPKSEPKYEPTNAERAAQAQDALSLALDTLAQLRKQQPAAPYVVPNEVPDCKPGEYEPTDAERAVLDWHAQRQMEQPPAPRLKVVDDYGGARVEVDHPEPVVVGRCLLKEALGIVDDDFFDALMSQLSALVDLLDANAEAEVNMVLSTIINGKPKDHSHIQLLFQQGACFLQSARFMQYSHRIEDELSAVQRDLRDKKFSRMINENNYSLIENLSRLKETTQRNSTQFIRMQCLLVEASDRHGRAGEPSLTVQQLTVARQAFVGNISHATPQTAPNNPTAGPRVLTDRQHSAMPIIGEPDRVAIPFRRRKKSND